MKITFCIKGCSRKPIGGQKILYEFANRLSNKGHSVTIVFPSMDMFYQLPLPVAIRVFVCKLLTDVTRVFPPWFKLDKRIKLITTKDYDEKNFPDADAIVATQAETALPVSKLPDRCGKKIYFIQDYETWAMKENELIKTYRLGMTNIVISIWLKKLVEDKSGTIAYCIPNAIDTKKFRVFKSIEERNAVTIGLLWHIGEHKGLKYALNALNHVKNIHPEIQVVMFGATPAPDDLPSWYEFHFRASESEVIEIYNRCSIFVCATIDEGFGLTGAESMACGCALASTDYTGVREYAIHNYNALLSPVKNSHQLADNVCRLIEDNDLRMMIARNGVESIKKRTWEQAVIDFEEVAFS